MSSSGHSALVGRRVWPPRLAMLAWLCCAFVAGERAATAGLEVYHGDQRYLCRYGADCFKVEYARKEVLPRYSKGRRATLSRIHLSCRMSLERLEREPGDHNRELLEKLSWRSRQRRSLD